MATLPEQIEDDTEEEVVEQDDDRQDGQEVAETEDDDDDADDVVSFGGTETSGEPESEGMRNLRARLKVLEQEKRQHWGKPQVEDIGPKPNIDDYWENPDQFETDLLAWSEKKRAQDDRAGEQEKAAQAAQEKWQSQEREFEGSWSSLRNAAKDSARAKVEDAFTPEQQAMLVKAARGNGAGLFFMLGTNDESLTRLREMTSDPVEFVAEAAAMAKDIQVTKRKPTTQPETAHRSSGAAPKGDAKLERLQREAEQSGEYTKLFAYKRELRAAGKL